MKFFFVKDHKHKYRYFSTEPIQEIQVKFSRLEKIWNEAKKRLMLLPKKTLSQEQAFMRILKLENNEVKICHSGSVEERKIRHKFYFFLQKQRTKHILLLAGETLLLPISGIAVLLPGPNVFFGVLALLMITHWRASKGISKLLKIDHQFAPVSLLKEWEAEVEANNMENYPLILKKIEKEHNLNNIHKILWK
jgi:hypothetical protein